MQVHSFFLPDCAKETGGSTGLRDQASGQLAWKNGGENPSSVRPKGIFAFWPKLKGLRKGAPISAGTDITAGTLKEVKRG